MTAPTNIASSLAPPFSMVSKYFIAAVVSFVVLAGLSAFFAADIQGHHFQPKLLALTHIATLGWVTMIIFGAMYQLVPVVLEVKLFSAKLGEIQFWLYVVGILGLVYGFWSFNVGVHFTASASLVTLAILIFIVNVVITMTNVTKWNLTGLYLLTALVYLTITALAGLLLSINLGFPFISRIHLDYLKIHAHLGFIGWVAMVIMGVGLKLIPMFGLSHGFSTTPAKVAYVLVNIGLLGTTVEWLMTGPGWLLQCYIGLLAVGIVAFLFQLVEIFRHRMKKNLDIGMKHSAVAFGYFLLSMATGVFLAFAEIGDERMKHALVLTYGAAVLFGFFSMLIVGQMYKIVPFLVWFHTFSDRVGKEQVPMLKEMFSERLGTIQFWLINFGILFMLGGLQLTQPHLLRAGFALIFLASVLFAVNIGNVFRLRIHYGHQRTDR
jgi:cbb3-type cytochrome oxidase subunit 1